MSVYLQFDSLARSDAFIQKDLGAGEVWVPNDNYPNSGSVYQTSANLIQTPSNYRVFYKELNSPNNTRTIGFLAHCKERPENLTFSVEACTLTMPSNGLVPRVDEEGNVTYISVINEPYLYVRMMPINHAEGGLIYSNNPNAQEATFILWCDKIQAGTQEDPSPPIENPVPRPNPLVEVADLQTARWVVYKSCMITTMRLDLQADEWQIRIYDRYGNDIILAEDDNGGAGFADVPAVDPDIQTMLVVGIKPNYPL